MKGNGEVGREILELEKKYWSAIKDKDSQTAMDLSSDPCMVVGSQGVGEIDKESLARMLKGAPSQLKDFKFEDVHIRNLTEDVVVVAYKVREELVVEGRTLDLDAFDSSVWVRRQGQWVCVVHTESVAGDPYGRH